MFIFFCIAEVNQYKPEIQSVLTEKKKPAFHGEIHEDERVVMLKPQLAAIDRDDIGAASRFTFACWSNFGLF